MGVLYGIFQKIHPSVGEGAAIMGVCPIAYVFSFSWMRFLLNSL
ncbi:hypothetical protein STRDD11_00062 [Streptococcus sp. DD11]|nr:hypothetical protein STRDD11_00062 [Streptococcus sp. DD11]